jgi:ATP-dependent RNA helicase DDX56/DBP9
MKMTGAYRPFSRSPTMAASAGSSADSFSAFAHVLDSRILRALADLGFAHPTAVQRAALPLALDSRDILCRARTGSGKTAAYAIPLVQKVLAAKSVGELPVLDAVYQGLTLLC